MDEPTGRRDSEKCVRHQRVGIGWPDERRCEAHQEGAVSTKRRDPRVACCLGLRWQFDSHTSTTPQTALSCDPPLRYRLENHLRSVTESRNAINETLRGTSDPELTIEALVEIDPYSDR